MRLLICFDGFTAFHYGGARPNLPLHQAPKSMALVNFLLERQQWNRQGDNPGTRILRNWTMCERFCGRET